MRGLNMVPDEERDMDQDMMALEESLDMDRDMALEKSLDMDQAMALEGWLDMDRDVKLDE
jgi:hypothetical protein